jgi:signal transduction histidine kinase
MYPSPRSSDRSLPNRLPGKISLRLDGHRLLLARLTWFTVSLLAIIIFVASIPSRWADFQQVCESSVCTDGQLTPATARSLQELGVSVEIYAASNLTLQIMITLGYCAIAALIVWRRRDEWIALFASLMLIAIGVYSPGTFDPLVSDFPVWGFPVKLLRFIAPLTVTLFLLIFPDGHFSPRWTRWLAVSFIAYGLIISFFLKADALLVNQTWASQLTILVLLAQWSIVVGLQIYRYWRRSDPVQRQQTKWVVLGMAITIGALVVFILPAFFAPSLIAADSLYYVVGGPFVNALTLAAPISIGIAVLRYGLWHVDLLINRTLVYTVLTALVVTIYVVIVGVLGTLFHTSGHLLVSILATGAVAVFFHPLRQAVQRAVSRLMFGERDNPYFVLSRLGQRLEATRASEAVLPGIVEIVAQALKTPYVALEYYEGDILNRNVAYGQPTGESHRLPLVYHNETMGWLVLAPRARGEAFSPADQSLLQNIVRQSGAAVYIVRLNADLQRSREQLVTAREEERRRLRRDLHDGLGPTLAAHKLKVGRLHALVERDPAAAVQVLAGLEADLATALADIRRLVYNLRPPALDQLGLVGALRDCAAQYQHGNDTIESLHIAIDMPAQIPALPAAVEVAAYRIVQEALMNVVKHAHAHRCDIRLALDSALEVSISDDGVGLPPEHRRGVGFQSMGERAAELGGLCTIEPLPEGGTCVYARLPLPKEALWNESAS